MVNGHYRSRGGGPDARHTWRLYAGMEAHGTTIRHMCQEGSCYSPPPAAPARSGNWAAVVLRWARIAGACAFRVVAVVARRTTLTKTKSSIQLIIAVMMRKTRLERPTPRITTFEMPRPLINR